MRLYRKEMIFEVVGGQIDEIESLTLKNKIQGILLVIIAVCFIVNYFITQEFIAQFVSALIAIFIIWTLPALQGTLRIITYGLLILAITFFIFGNAPFKEWADAVRVNLTLVSIFIFVPLLGIPIRLGGYLESLKGVFGHLTRKSIFLFFVSQTLTHILGVVLNIGSVTIVNYLSKAALIQSPRLLANAINRGFISTIFWSPYFAAMALILSMLPITWGAILPYSLGLVLISFFVSAFVDWPYFKKADIEFKNEVSVSNEIETDQEQVKSTKKIIELLLLLLFMMIAVLGIEFISTLSMVIIICLVALLFPLIWSLIYKKHSDFLNELKIHIFKTLPRIKNEVVLFFIAGFFSAAFVQTNISSTLVNSINAIFGEFTIGIAYTIIFLVISTAVVGLHPIVTVTMLASSVNPQVFGFSPEYYAVLLLTAWGISNTVSPATAVNNLLANIWKVDVTKVSLHWNMKYALIMAILLPIYLKIVDL